MIQWGIYSHVRLKIHREYEGSVYAEVLTTWYRPAAGLRKRVRALEIHAYNLMTNNSLPSTSHYTHTFHLNHSDCSLQIISYSPLPNSPQLPTLTGLANTPLEPRVLWGWTNTCPDERLMEPDSKDEMQWHFSASLKNSQSSIRAIKRMKEDKCSVCTPETRPHKPFFSFHPFFWSVMPTTLSHTQGSSSKSKAIV